MKTCAKKCGKNYEKNCQRVKLKFQFFFTVCIFTEFGLKGKGGIILNDFIGCNVAEQTKIIGFTPQDACAIVEEALKNDKNWLVGKFDQKFHM